MATAAQIEVCRREAPAHLSSAALPYPPVPGYSQPTIRLQASSFDKRLGYLTFSKSPEKLKKSQKSPTLKKMYGVYHSMLRRITPQTPRTTPPFRRRERHSAPLKASNLLLREVRGNAGEVPAAAGMLAFLANHPKLIFSRPMSATPAASR